MTQGLSSALDPEAQSELERYTRRAKRVLLTSGLALLGLFVIVPVLDLSIFERLFAPVGGTLSIIAGTSIGSLRRAKQQAEILRNSTWHRHKCEYAGVGISTNAGLILHCGAVLTLRAGVLWRIGQAGLPSASHVEVADSGGDDVVLRVPGNGLLFTAASDRPG